MQISQEFIDEIQSLNPWLLEPHSVIFAEDEYLPRHQEAYLLDPEWDTCWTVLIGPRQTGKTTLAQHLIRELLQQKRFENVLYFNCDYTLTRTQLSSALLIKELIQIFALKNPIIFIDEVQRLENPGLLLKALIDLKLPVKLFASGSSQLEIKSKVQEYLTGRDIESIVLPLSRTETPRDFSLEQQLLYGSYPNVVRSNKKQDILSQLYRGYITKDIIEILKIGKPDVIEKLIALVAHSSGQLVDYQQLATDCRVSTPTIQSYLDILEKTYVLSKITPFVGNKRSEITHNPVYYFIDNGFRNQAIRNFQPLDLRGDVGLLVQGFVFQEILKFKTQYFLDFNIHFWRTKTQAEVDFVLYKNELNIVPIEVKFSNMKKATISRGFRSFLQAYQPPFGIIVTKSLQATLEVEAVPIHFIPLPQLEKLFKLIRPMI